MRPFLIIQTMAEQRSTADSTGDESSSRLTTVAMWALMIARITLPGGSGASASSDSSLLERWGNRLTPAVKGLLVTGVVALIASNPVAAQEYCSDGIGLLIADTQVMLWQFVLGMLVIVALVGLVLRAFPIFTGATAMGNLMIVGVIVGVIGFVFILTFIEFAFNVVGGPSIADGCSPFL